MDGTAIVIITLVVVAASVLIIWGSFRLLEDLNHLYNNTEGKVAAKAVLFIPYIILAIWCFILQVVLFIITLGVLIDTAGNLRDWWQKGSKK